MAFKLSYNEIFSLRLINFAKMYLDVNGTISAGNKVSGQLSKLQVIDFFFPSLLIRISSEERDEAFFDYRSCYIYALRIQGTLSNQGTYKQKINDIEDCLLGNSRNEKKYKNYNAAHTILRRAANDLINSTDLFTKTVSNLRNIYEQLDSSQKLKINTWLGNLISSCHEDNMIQTCTAARQDGFSFETETFRSLIDRAELFYRRRDFRDCYAWLCMGSLFGNYVSLLLQNYHPDFFPVSEKTSVPGNQFVLGSSPIEDSSPYFCGRENELQQIHNFFLSGNRVLFLHGIGGIGKTELAKQYAVKNRNHYKRIIFVPYENSLKKSVISLSPFELTPDLPREKSNGKKEDDSAYFRRKLDLIHKSCGPETLIILDGFDTENDPDFKAFINGRFKVLITSRIWRTQGYTSMKVDPINDEDALIELFMNHYHGYAVEKDDPYLLELIHSVDGHTYTLIMIARHMENSGQTPEEMLRALNQEGIISMNEMIMDSDGNEDKAYRNLLKLFRVSRLGPKEQYSLQLLSLLPPTGMPAMVFVTWSGLSSTRVLLNLEKQGWLMRNGKDIYLHAVIQKVIRYVLPVHDESIQQFFNNAAAFLANENSWHFTKSEKEKYILITQHILSELDEINEYTVVFVQSAAVLLGYSGYSQQAVEIDHKLYQFRQKHDGPDAFETGRAAYRLGWLYLFSPQLENQLDNAGKWLNTANRIFSVNNLDSIDKKAMYCGLLENLSKVFSQRYTVSNEEKDLATAKEYAEDSVRLSRKWLQGYHETKKSPAGSLLRLADVYMDLKDYPKAESLIEEAYRILSYMYPPQKGPDADLLRATSRKAMVLYHLGKYEESLSLTEQNLQNYRKLFGFDNPAYFSQLVLKAKNCSLLGKHEVAAQSLAEAREAGQRIFPENAPELSILNTLPES